MSFFRYPAFCISSLGRVTSSGSCVYSSIWADNRNSYSDSCGYPLVVCNQKMKIKELANKEEELCSKVEDLYHHPQTEGNNKALLEIFNQYRLIHQQYADLAEQDDEALKRGIFIQWYAMTEPDYLTGIGELNRQAKIDILNLINKKLQKGTIDDEFKWMLDYYLDWEWVFEPFKDYPYLEKAMINRNYNLPESINRQAMKQRGQMGKYWNSLNCFTKNEN
jgi:hypothetical protein